MEKLNQVRTTLRNRYIIEVIIIIMLIIVVAMYVNPGFFILILIIGRIITVKFNSKLEEQYRKEFKDTFVLKALESKFTNLVYDFSKGIPRDVISNTKMMWTGDEYHSEDYISAEYKDIKFEQSDVHITEEREYTDSEGRRRKETVTIFKGRWLIFEFNKEFKANIQIAQKNFAGSTVKTKKTIFDKFNKTEEELFKKVSMESETFNKKFNVFAQNEHDAFYIITPSLMERIERLEEKNKGTLLFCFVNNKLHIGICDNKNSFEPGSVFKKINEEETIRKTSAEIGIITQFVDELNLDNNLFKKEI